jgi:hypothetical protein
MSNPAQVLSRHRKTPLPPVVPTRQTLVSWTTGNQNANSESTSSSVTADTVKNYLGEHPEFLDSYIQQNVNPNTIEQWMSKKPQTPPPVQPVHQQRNASATTHHPPPSHPPTPPPRPSSSLSSSSMPVVSPQKNNISTSATKLPLSTTIDLTTISSPEPASERISSTTAKSAVKLAELTDQRRLLHELTDEVNQNVTKAQILFELSKSIASTIAADDFNLYLVDETGSSMRLFTSDNDE